MPCRTDWTVSKRSRKDAKELWADHMRSGPVSCYFGRKSSAGDVWRGMNWRRNKSSSDTSSTSPLASQCSQKGVAPEPEFWSGDGDSLNCQVTRDDEISIVSFSKLVLEQSHSFKSVASLIMLPKRVPRLMTEPCQKSNWAMRYCPALGNRNRISRMHNCIRNTKYRI